MLDSKFAILDVRRRRKAIAKLTGEAKIPVIIKGYLVGAWSHDDGESQEFQVDVVTAEIAP